MKKVLINFMTSNTGGVVNFKRSILKVLNDKLEESSDLYYILLDDCEIRHNKHLKNLKFITVITKNIFEKIYFYEVTTKKRTKNLNINLILNFGDIPAKGGLYAGCVLRLAVRCI